VAKAFTAIADLLNERADQLLTRMDILDVENWLGTILSSRRSAEIALYDYGSDGWEDFVNAKKDYWLHGNDHRQQSNNSLLFHRTPSRSELSDIFDRMVAAGGSEPGFINAVEAERRAPWFQTLNPCAEILLPNKGFCNLVEINVAAFPDFRDLLAAIRIMARANYRQTCVDLRDGILQEAWHTNNEFLRLCGVGLTGIAQRPDLVGEDLEAMRREAHVAAYSMADEFGTPRPKNVTTIKPSGTLSKVMDCTEGLHKPLGKYIINNVGFSVHDPLVPMLKEAGYRVFDKPGDSATVLVALPVKYEGVDFDDFKGTPVNLESAVSQLERYKMYQQHWTDQNTSVTISYDPTEVPDIVNWLLDNWDYYVGVSFIFRNDPTKTARDLGYDYLPQEVVTKEEYEDYVSKLSEVDLDKGNSHADLEEEGCAGGVCPIK
jgi:ribonucleoside-triphosphate reductase